MAPRPSRPCPFILDERGAPADMRAHERERDGTIPSDSIKVMTADMGGCLLPAGAVRPEDGLPISRGGEWIALPVILR
jgi:hypothetical protein